MSPLRRSSGGTLQARRILGRRAFARPGAVVLTDTRGRLTAEDLHGQLQLMEQRDTRPPRLSELPAAAPLRQVLVTALAGDGQLDLRSSGATGAPRVHHRGPSTAAQQRTWNDLAKRIGLRRHAVVATALPGVQGLGLRLALESLAAGAPLVDLSHLSVQRRLAMLHRTTPHLLVGTPMHLADLLEADGELSGHRALRIPRIASGADRLDPELHADLARHWRARVHDVYGTTETGMLAVDGRPLRGVRIRSRDGVLRARTPVTGRRWLVTDRGEVDEQGRVTVLGRLPGNREDEGMAPDPRAVVRLLQTQPGIVRVRLRVVPDAQRVRRTIAHVTVDESVGVTHTAPGVQALVHDRLGAASVPSEVRISSRGR